MKEFISIFLLILATLVGKGQETRNHHSGSQVESGQDVGTALTSPLESPLPTPLLGAYEGGFYIRTYS